MEPVKPENVKQEILTRQKQATQLQDAIASNQAKIDLVRIVKEGNFNDTEFLFVKDVAEKLLDSYREAKLEHIKSVLGEEKCVSIVSFVMTEWSQYKENIIDSIQSNVFSKIYGQDKDRHNNNRPMNQDK